jgi:hypothetical protein
MDIGDIAYKILEILLPILVAGLTWASAKLASFINAKVKNEYLKGTLARLNDAVLASVKEAQQVAVQGLKEANKDGKVTKEEAAKIKEDVLAVVKSHLGMRGLQELARVLGLDTEGVQKLLSSKIEAAVHDIKASSANPPGVVPG